MKLTPLEAKAVANMFKQSSSNRSSFLYISTKKYNVTHVSDDEIVGKSEMSSLKNLLLVKAGDVILLALDSGSTFTNVNTFNILIKNAAEHFKDVKI
jgi:hypothetical protein